MLEKNLTLEVYFKWLNNSGGQVPWVILCHNFVYNNTIVNKEESAGYGEWDV